MSNFEINCPHCGGAIELTEALAAPLLEAERQKVDAEVKRRMQTEIANAEAKGRTAAEADAAGRIKAAEATVADVTAKLREAEEQELAVRHERERLMQEKAAIDLTIQRRVDEEKERAIAVARAAADIDWTSRLGVLEQNLATKDAKLREAEQAEIQARQLKSQAEEALRQAELTVARRLDEERSKVRETAMHERDEEHRLKLGEKDKQLEDMRKQIEELRRKGDRAAQQLVGDILELDLQDVLSSAFPHDQFERIKKGQSGGDLLQTVRTASGQACGRILWESKRTKNWSDGWLGKLREDQRTAKSDLAALVTETLPGGLVNFGVVDGVWVSGIDTSMPMAAALRMGLIETARARIAAEGAGTKKDLVYTYLTGAEFRQRVVGMLEPIVDMRDSLAKEKALITRQWGTREKQLERALSNVANLYGDLHGLVGSSLPSVEGLSFPALDAPAAQLPEQIPLNAADRFEPTAADVLA